jgi:hypothetical protein
MGCPECNAQNPELARFCLRCGASLRAIDAAARRGTYAVHPSESVVQLALISTLLPHTNRRAANEYRWALFVSAAAILVLGLVGLAAPAVAAASFLIPVTYLVYLHDSGLWQDRRASVVTALYGIVGLGAVLVSVIFFLGLGESFFAVLSATADRGGLRALPLLPLVIFSVGLPAVSEVVKQIGPVLLARRPQFDDMLDGFTFGVAAGATYAGFESLIAFGAVFSAERVYSPEGLGGWLVVILNLMVIKPVIYGCATGIAAAAFSGRGEGYDGFTPSYVAHFLVAVAANVVYWLGIRLLATAPFGAALGLLWGAVVAAVLLVRARTTLQAALVESALEDAAADGRSKWATTDGGFCPECESVLLADAMFCVICGSSVRATSGTGRRHVVEAAPRPAAPPRKKRTAR